jgi:fructose-bisphosphate aldolase/2-amino-3,7-dideoxy-D-threo-hept-6-ulosonate synthase
MTTGTTARLDRLGTDGRFLTVPMDHGVTVGAVRGLRDLESTVAAVARGGADAILTHKGLAGRVHPHKGDAGYIVHLNASTVSGPDSTDKRTVGSVEAAIRAGADAVSFHVNVGSDHEPRQLGALGSLTETADHYGIPVLAMTYARGPDVDESDPDALGHAVRLGEELGADLIKTGYSGDADSFRHVVESTSKPVLIAGGEPDDDRRSLEAVHGAIEAGAAGVSMGRTIFQHDDPESMTRAVSTIIHDDGTVDEALERAGLAVSP